MEKLKFSLILTLVVVLAFVAPLATYATEATTSPDTAGEPVTTAETQNEPVVTSETLDQAVVTSETPEATDETATTDTTNPEEAIVTDGEVPEEGAETTAEPLEEVKGNYYDTNTNLVFNKAVDGNAFLFGDTITIKGQVNGDLFVIGKNVTLEQTAQIYGNVFLLAENFTHVGLVYNLFAMVSNYTCEYDGMTALDLKVFAENIKFSGYVERSVYFSADSIELTDDAYILGNFVYNSSNEPTIGESTSIYGEKSQDNFLSLIKGSESEEASNNQIVDHLTNIATLLGSILLILLIVNFFKPNTLTSDVKFGIGKLLKAFFVGLLSMIILVVAIILLFLSTIFIEASLILLIALILASLLTGIVSILTLATIIYNKFNKGKTKFFVVLYAIVLSLIYYAIPFIPYAGIIINLIINTIGFGLIILYFFNIRKRNKVVKISDTDDKTVKKDSKIDDKKEKKNAKDSTSENKEDKEDKKDNDSETDL